MAWNNGFPATYQPFGMPQYQAPIYQPQQMQAAPPVQAYSYAPPPEPVENTITYDSDTEFGQRIHGRDPEEVWPLIDELTEALAVVNPRLYDSFIQRL